MSDQLRMGEDGIMYVKGLFTSAVETVAGHTGMDKWKLFRLWSLAGQSMKLPEGEVIEVGCGNGGSGCLIGKRVYPEKIHLCDTFAGLVKCGPHDTFRDGDMAGAKMEAVYGLAVHMGLDNANIRCGTFPENADDIKDRRFRFAHLDVDTYQSTKDAFEWLWPRMVPGGVVVFDDYCIRDCPGISRYVGELLEIEDGSVQISMGQATIIKLQGEWKQAMREAA